MKVVHICMGFPIEYNGGITNYVRSLAAAQCESSHEVIVYCNGEAGGDAKQPYIIKRYNSTIRPFSLDIMASDNTYSNFYHNLLDENADMYHIHSLLGVDSKFAETFSHSNLNYIISLHDYNFICPRIMMVHKNGSTCRELSLEKCTRCVGVIEQRDLFGRILKRVGVPYPSIKSNNVYVRYERFSSLLKNAKLLLPVSTRVGEIFKSTSRFNQKVITIGNDTAYLKKSLNKYEKTPNKLRVAFLGSFSKVKGAELFIELCKKNENPLLSFEFFGRGDKELLDKFVKAGGRNNGEYKSSELKNILEDIHLGAALPIWEDNGPQVVMEFINNFIPVLATQRGGIPDFVNEVNGFLFEPDQGIQSASNWLNTLTVDKLQHYHENILQLKTPLQHADEINNIYMRFI